jgi:hypothetical protein
LSVPIIVFPARSTRHGVPHYAAFFWLTCAFLALSSLLCAVFSNTLPLTLIVKCHETEQKRIYMVGTYVSGTQVALCLLTPWLSSLLGVFPEVFPAGTPGLSRPEDATGVIRRVTGRADEALRGVGRCRWNETVNTERMDKSATHTQQHAQFTASQKR